MREPENINLKCYNCTTEFVLPILDHTKVGMWALKKAMCSGECEVKFKHKEWDIKNGR